MKRLINWWNDLYRFEKFAIPAIITLLIVIIVIVPPAVKAEMELKAKCEAAGGVWFAPRGAGICFAKDTVIKVRE